jgi:hypothetical protein
MDGLELLKSMKGHIIKLKAERQGYTAWKNTDIDEGHLTL